jgi:multidrug resistance efflux pump
MRILLFLAAGGMFLTATACGQVTRVVAAPKPLEVLVADVRQRDVPLYREWIGTGDRFVGAEIKAQVSGFLVKREYTEGSFVRRGQLLFQIGPRPFQAEPDQAKGRLAQPQGQLAQARAQLAQAGAEVAAAKANQHRVPVDMEPLHTSNSALERRASRTRGTVSTL